MSFSKPSRPKPLAPAPPPPEQVRTNVNADGANEAATRVADEATRVTRRRLRIAVSSNPTAGGGSGLAIY